MTTELAALTFSSKAVRVGSSCSLKSKGSLVTLWARKGAEECGVLQLRDPHGHLRRYGLGALCLSYGYLQ